MIGVRSAPGSPWDVPGRPPPRPPSRSRDRRRFQRARPECGAKGPPGAVLPFRRPSVGLEGAPSRPPCQPSLALSTLSGETMFTSLCRPRGSKGGDVSRTESILLSGESSNPTLYRTTGTVGLWIVVSPVVCSVVVRTGSKW
jgi:hypothetical protein